METAGMVCVGHVGNAVARLFPTEDSDKTAKSMYREDNQSFLKQTEQITPLNYGHTINNAKGTQCVVNPGNTFQKH